MIYKKKEFFLLIFLILLQSCSGGRIGNFLERSFDDVEKITQDYDSQKNLENKKVVLQENKETNDKNYEIRKKIANKKVVLQEDKETNNKNYETRKKVENEKTDLETKKYTSLEKIQKKKNKKIEKSKQKREIKLQSYKIIFILKDVDPKDPTEELNSILSNSEVNFEIEKIERILDSKNKSMNKN